MVEALSDTLSVLDGYNRLKRTLEACVDPWEVRQLFEALAAYRERGVHDIEGLPYGTKPLYRLMVNELNEQIRRLDPGWFRRPAEGAPAADATLPEDEPALPEAWEVAGA